MVNDPIGDFLIQLKNGYLANKKELSIPNSKMKESLARLLLKEGYLGKVEVITREKTKKSLKLKLVYNEKISKLTNVRRVSKPGMKVYVSKKNIPRVLGGFGIAIISTPSGLMTGKEAKEKGLGGEFICKLW